MDPATAAGIALAVVGLFPLCRDGFTLIVSCFQAHKDVKDAAIRLNIASGVHVFPVATKTLQAYAHIDIHQCVRECRVSFGMVWLISEEWGERWEINHSGHERESKLQKYLMSGPAVGKYVLVTLSAISDILADTEKLEKSYGIKIEQKPPVEQFFHVSLLYEISK